MFTNTSLNYTVMIFLSDRTTVSMRKSTVLKITKILHRISFIVALTTINIMRFPGGHVFPAVLCEITAQ